MSMRERSRGELEREEIHDVKPAIVLRRFVNRIRDGAREVMNGRMRDKIEEEKSGRYSEKVEHGGGRENESD